MSDLIVANFDEVVPWTRPPGAPSPPVLRGLWQKAALISTTGDDFIIAPVEPYDTAGHDGGWFSPRQIFVPARSSDHLCRDVLTDARTWSLVTDELSRAGKVRVWTQVFSAGAADLIRALISAGVAVDTSNVPRVSSNTIAFWNTKLGGRELLKDVVGVREALPAAVVCNTLLEVATWVVGESTRSVVVKADSSIGGAGVWMFPSGTARLPDEVTDLFTASVEGAATGAKPKPAAEMVGPFLVEEMIGDPATNVSPTADFLIWDTGEVEFVGVGEQLLGSGVTYRGSRSPVRADPEAVLRCIALGRRIGEELFRRGYRGPVNVDFVVTTAGRVSAVELNLRQSAPLDQLLAMRRLFGPDWAEQAAYICEEDVLLGTVDPTLTDLLDALMTVPRGEGDLVRPLAIYDGTNAETYASLFVASPDVRRADSLIAEASAILRGANGHRAAR